MTEGLIMALLLSCLDYGRGAIGVTTRTLKLSEHWLSAVFYQRWGNIFVKIPSETLIQCWIKVEPAL